MGQGYVHDERQRFSLELRPEARLDRAIRAVAEELERGGMIPPGAPREPRFQPHVTLLRASTWSEDACAAAAAAAPVEVRFVDVGTFGSGRIAWLAPDGGEQLAAMRAAALATLDPAALDPTAASRPWTPHVTVAYAIVDEHQDAALDLLRSHLPITGWWSTVEAWDLDVRPTVRVASCSVG